ncbi:MAG: hypothetical protein MHMPM18_003239 [Marteilia pararefringens]
MSSHNKDDRTESIRYKLQEAISKASLKEKLDIIDDLKRLFEDDHSVMNKLKELDAPLAIFKSLLDVMELGKSLKIWTYLRIVLDDLDFRELIKRKQSDLKKILRSVSNNNKIHLLIGIILQWKALIEFSEDLFTRMDEEDIEFVCEKILGNFEKDEDLTVKDQVDEPSSSTFI